MSIARKPWFLILFFGLLVLATRLPLAPGQLFTFDDVNLAYSVGHYDIRMSQPHPPGYPLFVAEMRLLWWLRFRRAESLLLALALAGSVAALLLAVHCGNRIFGGDAGFWGAIVLLFSPVFWHTGVTSALRVQLAMVSLGVAACCWKAWNGDAAWVRYSAIALAIGAGIRPETGVLLFPLWAVSVVRAPVGWEERGRALVWLAATVAVWLLPAMMASGGPVNFIRANLDYISDQASVSSGLFGANDRIWLRTFYRLAVWVFCPVVALTLPAVLAWRRPFGWGVGLNRWMFLGLWFVPAYAFALTVHVEDPGQTLIMGVVVALLGGYWIECAISRAVVNVSPYLLTILVAATCILCRVRDYPNDIWRMQWTAVAGAAVGVAMRLFTVKNRGDFFRWQAIALMLGPLIYIEYTCFHHAGWYFQGKATTGVEAIAERAWADINSGFALTSLEQIRNTLAVDDGTLRSTMRLAGERRGQTVVVWEEGLTAWRKVGYYMPDVPVFVLEHKRIRGATPPVTVEWRGSRLVKRQQGATPLRLQLPAGARVVWLLNPRSDFADRARREFGLASAGPVYYGDLPAGSGSRLLGEYEIAW